MMRGQMAICEETEGRSVRRIMSLAGYARERDQKVIDVDVLDLSIDGCRIGTTARLEEAVEIWLKIPEVAPRCARIRWVREREAGCEFNDPIDSEIVEHLKRTATQNILASSSPGRHRQTHAGGLLTTMRY